MTATSGHEEPPLREPNFGRRSRKAGPWEWSVPQSASQRFNLIMMWVEPAARGAGIAEELVDIVKARYASGKVIYPPPQSQDMVCT